MPDEKPKKQTTLDGKMAAEVGTALVVVRNVMQNNPKSRGDDNLLLELVLKECDRMGVKRPAFSTVDRARRKIQNKEGDCLPPADVIEMRRKRQEQMRIIFAPDKDDEEAD